MSSPSSSAELVSTHNDGVYTSFLVLHCIALVVFGVGVYLSGDVWRRINKNLRGKGGDDDGRVLPGALYFGLALGIFIISLVSIWAPRYEVFVDLSAESIVKREARILVSGVTQQNISFGEVATIAGERERLRYDNRYRYRYILSVLTQDGRWIELWRSPWNTTGAIPSKATSLANAIAEKSGARMDLR